MPTARITRKLPRMLMIRNTIERVVVRNERCVGAPLVRQRSSNVPWKYDILTLSTDFL